jgi:hypothetical protein
VIITLSTARHHVSLVPSVELINGIENRFTDFDEGRVNAHRSPIA